MEHFFRFWKFWFFVIFQMVFERFQAFSWILSTFCPLSRLPGWFFRKKKWQHSFCLRKVFINNRFNRAEGIAGPENITTACQKKKTRSKIFFHHGEIWFWKNIFEKKSMNENIFQNRKMLIFFLDLKKNRNRFFLCLEKKFDKKKIFFLDDFFSKIYLRCQENRLDTKNPLYTKVRPLYTHYIVLVSLGIVEYRGLFQVW